MKLIPGSIDRVSSRTAESVQRRINESTEERLEFFRQHPEGIPERLQELQREWDLERSLQANAATLSLLGLILGARVDRRFYLLPGVVAGFLLMHAVQGWCPPMPIMRRMGIRTLAEIQAERDALLAIQAETKAGSVLDEDSFPGSHVPEARPADYAEARDAAEANAPAATI